MSPNKFHSGIEPTVALRKEVGAHEEVGGGTKGHESQDEVHPMKVETTGTSAIGVHSIVARF